MEFSKTLSIGNRILDFEHMKLHDIIDMLAHSIVVRDMAALSEAFELLENCLCAYFVVEKNIAQAVNFDFAHHERTHQYLLSKSQRLKAELIAKNGKWLEWEVKYYINSLRNYLTQHIREDSKPLSIVLNAHFYDLKPNEVPANNDKNAMEE